MKIKNLLSGFVSFIKAIGLSLIPIYATYKRSHDINDDLNGDNANKKRRQIIRLIFFGIGAICGSVGLLVTGLYVLIPAIGLSMSSGLSEVIISGGFFFGFCIFGELGSLLGKQLIRGFSWLQSKLQGSDTIAPTNPEKWKYHGSNNHPNAKNSQKILNQLYLKKQEIKATLNLTFFSSKHELKDKLHEINRISCKVKYSNFNSDTDPAEHIADFKFLKKLNENHKNTAHYIENFPVIKSSIHKSHLL